MPLLARVLVYATLFAGLVLVGVPAGLLRRAGVAPPSAPVVLQVAGTALAAAGALLAAWCVLAFWRHGRGTPAPFDPPRHLVVRGPYRFVRNPMYVGAGAALLGASLAYGSPWLAGYLVVLAVASHLFVVRYEEPRLRRTFGAAYEDYCRAVGRWWPRRS